MNTTFKSIVCTLCAIIVSCSSSIAQKQPIKWSSSFKEEKGEVIENILYDSGESVYLYVKHISKGQLYVTPGILKLDKNLEPVQRQDFYKENTIKENIYIKDIFYCGGKFVMLTEHYEEKTNTKTVFATSIDMRTLEPDKEFTEIWKVTGVGKRNVTIDYSLSADTNLISLVATISQKDQDLKVLSYKVLDANFKSANENTVTLKHISEKIREMGNIVSNTGDIYFFYKLYNTVRRQETTTSSSKDKTANYVLTVMKFSPRDAAKEITISIGNKRLDRLVSAIDPVSTDLVTVLSYTDIDDKYLIGYEFIRIKSETGDIVSRKPHEFTADLVEKMKRMEPDFKMKSPTPAILKTFTIEKVHITSDGRVFLIFENDIVETATDKYGYTYNIYKIRGIVASMYDLNGELKWLHYIPKNQFRRMSPGEMYTGVIIKDDKLLIIYNDHIRNIQYDIYNSQEPPKPFAITVDVSLMMVDITNEGMLTRNELYRCLRKMPSVTTWRTVKTVPNRAALFGWNSSEGAVYIGMLDL